MIVQVVMTGLVGVQILGTCVRRNIAKGGQGSSIFEKQIKEREREELSVEE